MLLYMFCDDPINQHVECNNHRVIIIIWMYEVAALIMQWTQQLAAASQPCSVCVCLHNLNRLWGLRFSIYLINRLFMNVYGVL